MIVGDVNRRGQRDNKHGNERNRQHGAKFHPQPPCSERHYQDNDGQGEVELFFRT